jgi:predicted MFS family arabinose efflux permease
MAWIGDTVHYEQRQATLARFMGGQILGAIGGQFIGGVFADTLGWRWAFAFLATLYLVIGAIVLLESRANPSTHHRHADTPRKGIIGQAAQVFAQPWARVILSIVFLEGMLVFGALAFVPSYLHERFGLSLTMAGAAMAFFGIGGLTYILAARHFVRRLGEVGLATGGGILIALGWAMLSWGESWLWALPASYCVGLGFYMLHNTLQTNATQMAPAVRGTAVSLFASSFFLGQSLGVMVAAHILAIAGIIPMLLIAAAGTPLVGCTLAWLLARHHRKYAA